MTQKEWHQLKAGDTIVSRAGTPRKILAARNGCVTLRKISFATHRLWSGRYKKAKRGDTTVYVTCDCSYFERQGAGV